MGGATWVRAAQFSTVKYKFNSNFPTLTSKGDSKEDLNTSDKSTQQDEDYTDPSPGNLNATDLISHQLIVDYVNLSQSGQATDQSIDDLAEKYVDSLPTLNNAEIFSYAELNSVSNTPSNFQNYADGLKKIETEYSEAILKTSVVAKTLNYLGNNTYSTMRTFGNAYKNAADKLKVLPVPIALAEVHLELVNNYLSSSSAAIAISNTEKDSTFAFVGLVTLKKNMDEEDSILNSIDTILHNNNVL